MASQLHCLAWGRGDENRTGRELRCRTVLPPHSQTKADMGKGKGSCDPNEVRLGSPTVALRYCSLFGSPVTIE